MIPNLVKDTKSDEVKNNEILSVLIKEEAREIQPEEMTVENQMQVVLENSIHTEIEIKDEIVEMFATETDSLDDIINDDCEEVIGFNENMDVIVKKEPTEIQITESEKISEEDAVGDKMNIKEEVEEFEDFGIQDNVQIISSG